MEIPLQQGQVFNYLEIHMNTQHQVAIPLKQGQVFNFFELIRNYYFRLSQSL